MTAMCLTLGIQCLIRQIRPISYETYSLKQWVETVKVGFVKLGQGSGVKRKK